MERHRGRVGAEEPIAAPRECCSECRRSKKGSTLLQPVEEPGCCYDICPKPRSLVGDRGDGSKRQERIHLRSVITATCFVLLNWVGHHFLSDGFIQWGIIAHENEAEQ